MRESCLAAFPEATLRANHDDMFADRCLYVALSFRFVDVVLTIDVDGNFGQANVR